jgi:hypothetical protein
VAGYSLRLRDSGENSGQPRRTVALVSAVVHTGGCASSNELARSGDNITSRQPRRACRPAPVEARGYRRARNADPFGNLRLGASNTRPEPKQDQPGVARARAGDVPARATRTPTGRSSAEPGAGIWVVFIDLCEPGCRGATCAQLRGLPAEMISGRMLRGSSFGVPVPVTSSVIFDDEVPRCHGLSAAWSPSHQALTHGHHGPKLERGCRSD